MTEKHLPPSRAEFQKQNSVQRARAAYPDVPSPGPPYRMNSPAPRHSYTPRLESPSQVTELAIAEAGMEMRACVGHSVAQTRSIMVVRFGDRRFRTTRPCGVGDFRSVQSGTLLATKMASAVSYI
jgi:hypothetical protein